MTPSSVPVHLRLVWPQWQGAGISSVSALLPDFELAQARRAYAVGAAALEATLPAHDGPTAHVPVSLGDDGLGTRDGVESKDAVRDQLRSALEVISAHDPAAITTIGGECSVSVAPFSTLAQRYGDDLAVLWIDSHPDIGTGRSEYAGYHAMAVSMITGHGDDELQRELPATVPGERVALLGLHSWTDDDIHNVADWGIASFAPDVLREGAGPVREWLAATGCSRVAIHFDVDTIDSDEIQFGLGADRGGLTTAEVRRIVAEVSAAAEVVGLTIAEYIPRQLLHLRALVADFPLIAPGDTAR